ncbi:MAG: glycosyltransferase family 2 protein [Thermoanaerobaculia bacterium]
MRRPRFSVVVPTFNRREALERTLAGYERQDSSTPEFEVLVVDDGSTDDTGELLDGWRSDRFVLRVEHQSNRGPAAARNRALAVASGEVVLFTGDDIEPAEDLLLRHEQAQRASPNGETAYFGRIDWPSALPTTATMRHITGRGAQQFSFFYLEDGREYDYRHFYTSNVSIPRQLLDREPELFSEAFPAAAFEDAELAFRLARHGLRLRYLAGARAWHWHHYDASSFFARQERCGEMAHLLLRMHPETGREIDLRVLSGFRWRSFLIAGIGRGRLRRLSLDLPARTAEALAAANDLDGGSDTDAAPLLQALFRFGFLAGATRRLYPPPVARRVEAALFGDLIEAPLTRALRRSA